MTLLLLTLLQLTPLLLTLLLLTLLLTQLPDTAAAALGVVYDVNEGGLWCMEGGHREGSVMHVEGVFDA